jgi:hypothetical protein
MDWNRPHIQRHPDQQALWLRIIIKLIKRTSTSRLAVAGPDTEKLPWYFDKYIMRRDIMPITPMYEFEEETETRHNSVVASEPKASAAKT